MNNFRITSILTLLGMLLASLLASCTASTYQDDSRYVEKSLDLEPFQKIRFEGAYNIKLIQSDSQSVVLSTSESLHDRIRVWVEDGTLRIKTRGNHIQSEEIKVNLSVRNLEEIKVEGGAQLLTEGYFDLGQFKLNVEGGANINMKIKADTFTAYAAGGVNIELEGVATQFTAISEGAGNIDADNLEARFVRCKVSGVGNASVYATEKLDATVEGVGKIGYRGNPTINKSVSGIGWVYRK
ncbi:MAG TPA: head GIN domain-containing protein [Prolixibacteraceae bacterium]|nr:head GIN domain-containing protein [Prolixibacteraceae bacterium]